MNFTKHTRTKNLTNPFSSVKLVKEHLILYGQIHKAVGQNMFKDTPDIQNSGLKFRSRR